MPAISHNLAYDFIRVFATVGVIAIHTEVITSSSTNYLGGLSWWFANTIHSLVSVSVPLFVMLSGALLFQKKDVTWRYVISKVLKQFVVPLIFWWLFFTIRQAHINHAPLSLISLIQNFFYCRVGHLYYLQIAIGLYLIFPLLQNVWERMSCSLRRFSLIFISLLSMIYSYGSYVWFKSYGTTNFLIIAFPFITYLLWGKVISQIVLTRKQSVFYLVALIFFVSTTSISTYKNVTAFNANQKIFWTPKGGNLFFEPFTLNVIIMSILVFLLLGVLSRQSRYIKNRQRLRKTFAYLASLTYGVYILHPLILELVDQYFHLSIQFITYPLWIYYLLKIFLVSVITGGVVAVINQIPYIRILIGGKRYMPLSDRTYH